VGSKIKIRQSQEADIAAISALLAELSEAGMRSLPSDPRFVRDRYVLDPNRVSSAVAELDQEIVGLQILSVAPVDNAYGVPVGWGIIGTHVSPRSQRLGIGRRLFALSRPAGAAAGLRQIDATIGATNDQALAFYESLGFRTYQTAVDLVKKRFDYPTWSSST